MREDLINKYREMADRGRSFYGLSIMQHMSDIRELVLATKSERLLDFGCGRGDAYDFPYWVQRYWHIEAAPALYDPAFVKHNVLPTGTFDGVICSDVLEHIAEEDVDEFVQRLFGYAEKFVWASVCCRPAKKSFDDGTNMHVTIKPMEWWKAKFDKYANGRLYQLTETK